MTKKLKYLIIVIQISFFLYNNFLQAQSETNHWYFGPGLDFNTNPPTIDNNGRSWCGEGSSSISDSNGQLLFYMTQWSDMDTIYNKLHQPMSNGKGINGNGTSTQSSLIIKKPGTSSIYYLFSQSGLVGGGFSAGGLRYSEINMNLAGGNGSVTAKNMSVYTNQTWGQTERLTAVRHCNGTDVWIMTCDIEPGNNFRCFLVSSAGVNTIGVTSFIGSQGQIGQAKFSPNGRKIGLANSAEIFDFDPATGIVTNSITLNESGYGCEFSPDGTKFYLSSGTASLAVVYQWDLCAGSNSAIINSKVQIGSGPASLMNFGSLQNASNGKIYVATLPTNSISVIHNPNIAGVACSFQLEGQSVGSKTCQWSLPNFITSNFKQLPSLFTYTLGSCMTVSFTSPPIPTIAPLCNAASLAYASISWDFGDPASSLLNFSNQNNTVHTFSSPGTYLIKLILNGACTSDTLRQKVNVLSNFLVANTYTICAGSGTTLTANGANNYSWSTGATNNSIIVQPTNTTTYAVTGTISPGCVVSKTLVINVSICAGLDYFALNASIHIYPNPFNNHLIIESLDDVEIAIFDGIGQELYHGLAQKGIENLYLDGLSNGFYIIRIFAKSIHRDFRLIRTTNQ